MEISTMQMRFTAGELQDRRDMIYEEAIRTRRHMWIFIQSWLVIDPEIDLQLDMENILGISGPGCCICKQLYKRKIADKPCPGEPG